MQVGEAVLMPGLQKEASMLVSAVEAWLLFSLGLFFLILLIGHFSVGCYLLAYERLLPKGNFTPKVSIIKPVKGCDPGAEENFASFCELDYPNNYELIFAAESRDDPAIQVIERILTRYPNRQLRLVISQHHPGGRIANMIQGVQEARYKFLLFSDTDVRASPDFLTKFVRPLGDSKVGLVFGCPAYRTPKSIPSAFLAMSVNPAILLLAPPAFSGYRWPIFRFGVGTTMALRKEVLSEIGGLEAFATQITEDVPLARAISNLGYRLHLVDTPITVVNEHESFRGWLESVHRWLVIVRCHMPLIYVLSLPYFFGIPHACIYFVFSFITGDSLLRAGILLASVVLAKAASMLIISEIFVADKTMRRYLWSLPLHDLLISILWLLACFTSEVRWRGMRYRILHGATAVRVH